MTPRIYITAFLKPEALALVHEALAGEDYIVADRFNPREGDKDEFLEAEVAFGNVAPDWLEESPKLQWLPLESTGFEYYLGCQGLSADLQITNLRGMFERPAAETAMAGLLGLFRGMNQLIPANRERKWSEIEVRVNLRLLHGSKAVVLGHGPVGMMANFHVARAGGGTLVEWPMLSYELRETLVPGPWHIEGGRITLTDAPGLGIELSEEIEQAYPFREDATYNCRVDLSKLPQVSWA